MNPKQSVLVVAAHPDDEVLGAGGAMAWHAERGDTVTILILGEGIAARAGVAPEEVARQQRELNAHAAAASIGVGAQSLRRAAFPDNAFDTVSLLSIVQEIEKVADDVKPSIIYTHHAGDTNVDHRLTAEAVDAVVRPMQGNTVVEVRSFEVPSSSEWNFTRSPFRPNVFVSLSEGQLKKKIDAMKAYVSEIREFPHPRSPEYLEALARVRGGQSGYMAAEAFSLVYARHG